MHSVDDRRIHLETLAGYGIAYAAQSREERRLRSLEERFAHELLDDEERQELRDWVLALRRRLARGEHRPPRAPGT
jgi:hypothetical protein